MSRKTVAIAVLVLIVGAGGFFTYKTLTAAQSVGTEVVREGEILSSVSAAGHLESRERAVAPAVAGVVAEVSVADGQQVKAGAQLFRVDPSPYEQAVRDARSALAAAKGDRSALSKTRASQEEIDAAAAQVDAAGSALDAAKVAYALAPTTENQLAVEESNATYLQAVAALDKLKDSGPTSEQRTAADARLTQADGALSRAQKNLEDATVEASIDGAVRFISSPTQRKLEAGMAVAAGQVVMTIASSQTFDFIAEVDETEVGKVKIDSGARVEVDAFPGKVLRGKVAEVATAATSTSTGGTVFKVKVTLDGMEGLRHGMNGSADFVLERKRGLTIPFASLIEAGGRQYVFVIEDGRAKRVRITVGLSTENALEVTKGLKAGEQVIVKGADKLSAGDRVVSSR